MDIDAAGASLGELLNVTPPSSYGLAMCDDCGKDFPIGEYTLGLLEDDPTQLIVCRECYKRRLGEVRLR